MLDRTEEITSVSKRRWIGDYLVPIAFLGVAGAATIAWITAIGWASWRLIARLF